jgi:nucleotide-binding universal stress UspA family protein
VISSTTDIVFDPLRLHRAPDQRSEPMAGFQRVAVAVDEATLASDVLAVAARAVDALTGRVRLIHVRPWRLAPPPSRDDGGVIPPSLDLFVETEEQAARLVNRAVAQVGARGVTAETTVVDAQQASVGAAIVTAAEAWDAELIVVGRHPRRRLSSLSRTGVSDQVTRRASCAVLLVHSTPV